MPKKKRAHSNQSGHAKIPTQNPNERENSTSYLGINAENFSNYGMLKLDFVINKIIRVQIKNFFYSIYGNTGYTLKGAFDISQLKSSDAIPSLFIKLNTNKIFFIKMKTIINNEETEFCKFIDLTNEKSNENINMNILDRSTEELFRSINLEDVDSESEPGDSNVSDANSGSASASNSDTEINDASPNGLLAINLH
jgi:hypothetical protein